MKIGITYDLKSDYLKEGFTEEEAAEFDREDTIDAIDNALIELGFQTDRIGHIRNLIDRLSKGHRWDLVFNICEGMYGLGREAQVPSVLDVYRIPYVFSDSVVLGFALHKAFTKRIVRDAGIATPDFCMINNSNDVAKVDIPFPLFLKPLAEGTSKGVASDSVVNNKDELKKTADKLLLKFNQPVLVERYMPGREFTVALIGTGKKATALGVMEVILSHEAEQGVYSYYNKENYKKVVKYSLVEDEIGQSCKQLALKVWTLLECRDAGRLDIRLDLDGTPNFIEINPLAGLHPEHSDLPIMARLQGISFVEIIKMIMDSATERIKNI